MKLASNQDLYQYLLDLSDKLKGRGATQSGELLLGASRKAAGMSTEFLGESRIALREVLREDRGSLNETERSDLSDVLQQLDAAFEHR
jgi:hypothetical protein